jgi:octaprenyl-diphosphate synthase
MMREDQTPVPTWAGEPTFPLLRSDLEKVRTALRRLFEDVSESIRPLLEQGAAPAGKLLRPALLLLSGRAFGSLTEDHYHASTALELIHTASLLHDDVLDHGLVRRGQATVSRRWGNQAALLLGDLLLGWSLGIIAGLPQAARKILSRVLRRTCMGEMRQVVGGGAMLAEPQYLALITEKTAALFEGACRLGAQLAGASSQDCGAVARFGHHFGIAYQMMDDLQDLIGDPATLRKTLGTDLQEGKVTLPLIHTVRMLPEPRRSSFLMDFETRRLAASQVHIALTETGSMDFVLSRIDASVAKAADSIREVRQSVAKAALLEQAYRIARLAAEPMRKDFAHSPTRRRVDGHPV